MLVLSRLEGQSITVPDIDLAVRVLRISGGKIRLGIEAPQHIRVLRGEVAASNLTSGTSPEPGSLQSRIAATRDALANAEKHLLAGNRELAEACFQQASVAFGSPESATTIAEGPVGYQATGSRRVPCVVVIGDELASADVLAELTENDAMDVRLAVDANEALELMSESAADFIVFDPTLSDTSTQSSIELIRGDGRFNSVGIYHVEECSAPFYGDDAGEEEPLAIVDTQLA